MLLSQFSKIVPIKTAYLRYAVCGCCLCIKNANCYKVIPLTYTVPASTFLLDNRSFPRPADRYSWSPGRQKPSDGSFAQGHFKCNVAVMRTKTSCYSSSTAYALLPICNILHFCRTSTSPLHFYLCALRQQGKQQWAFYFDLSFGFPHDLSHDCSQTDISPLDSPPYRNQGVSFHHKTEDTSSSTWPSEFSYYSIMVISGNQ